DLPRVIKNQTRAIGDQSSGPQSKSNSGVFVPGFKSSTSTKNSLILLTLHSLLLTHLPSQFQKST
ncbi:MAG: hypothetical protein IKJ45_09205, partial [Kiritimatiellae bacterium]|nr:hypothetical protein [Kiritimatiellia bacterium]